ncbi:Golgi-associated plant pathogenesis-related protein 1 isoform X1 [Ciona intestinalis]
MGKAFSRLFGTEEKKSPNDEPKNEKTVDVTPEPKEEETVTEQPKGDGSQYAKDMLTKHNEKRALHSTAAMALSVKLCEDAQKWADHIAAKNALEHCKDREGAGENLAWSSAELGADAAVDMWYNEIKDYDFSQPGFSGSTGHFTQVVWKASTEFGAGFAQASDGSTYVVGRYLPPGNMNMAGQFEENVLPLA